MFEFFTITILILLAVISPGPDFALIVRNSLIYSSKIGAFSALGTGCAALLHTSYTIIGLTVLISQSPFLFSIVKYIGAGYLIYIGLKGLFSKPTMHSQEGQSTIASITYWQAFQQGFLCNALNPKTMMFFLALFTLVIDATTLWWIKALYGLEIGLIHVMWFSFLAFMIGHPAVRAQLRRFQLAISRLMGAALVYFGSRLVML